MITKTITIREDQNEWLKKDNIALSRLVQSCIDKRTNVSRSD